MSNNIELLEYLQWADYSISKTLEKVNSEDINKSISETSGSIKEKLMHITEEYIGWLYDIKSESWSEIIAKVENMDSQQLFAQMKSTLREWIEFTETKNSSQFEIDEGEFKVPISMEVVIFNLVNHSSYHRGQIVLFLRIMGYEVKISDYYWYRIEILKLGKSK